MTFAGFFVHLNDIPPVLRWLQWICPLKYLLEGLAINEVDSGLMIEDTLQGVPISISAALIMHTVGFLASHLHGSDHLAITAFWVRRRELLPQRVDYDGLYSWVCGVCDWGRVGLCARAEVKLSSLLSFFFFLRYLGILTYGQRSLNEPVVAMQLRDNVTRDGVVTVRFAWCI